MKSLLLEWPYGPSGPPKAPTRFRWSPSAVKTWRTCKRQFYWKYILGLSSKKPMIDPGIGTISHDALEAFYLGKSTPSILGVARKQAAKLENEAMTSDYFDQDELDKVRIKCGTVSGMIRAYMECYADDLEDFEAMQPEPYWSVDMGDFDYVGRMDLVLKKAGRTILLETKTAGSPNEVYFQRLQLDTQVRSYFMACQEMGLKPTKVIYNVIRKSKLRRKKDESAEEFEARVCNDYMARPNHYFIREELRFNKGEMEAIRQEVQDVHWEYTCLLESGADLTDPRTWGINDNACTEWFRLCDFFELCNGGLDKGSGLRFNHYDRTKPKRKK